MYVRSILKAKGNDVVYVSEDTQIIEVTRVLKARRIGAVLVREGDGTIDGVLSERDIVRGLAERGEEILRLPAGALMTRKVITCGPNDEIQSALEVMTDSRIRHLPVLEGDELIGVISIGDLVKFRIQEKEQEAAALRDYIATG